MIGAILFAIYLTGLFFFWLLVYVSNKPNDPGPPSTTATPKRGTPAAPSLRRACAIAATAAVSRSGEGLMQERFRLLEETLNLSEEAAAELHRLSYDQDALDEKVRRFVAQHRKDTTA